MGIWRGVSDKGQKDHKTGYRPEEQSVTGDTWTPCIHCTIGPKGANLCEYGKHSQNLDVDHRGCWGGRLMDKTHLSKNQEYE
jgi:hypothetical protein